jgi:ATP-dependent DNA helicase RecG
VAIQPGGEVWEVRERLATAVERALQRLDGGVTAAAGETEGVDFKEEAGRRGAGGAILPGQARNQAVAETKALCRR